jgi:hypothetical protein
MAKLTFRSSGLLDFSRSTAVDGSSKLRRGAAELLVVRQTSAPRIDKRSRINSIAG